MAEILNLTFDVALTGPSLDVSLDQTTTEQSWQVYFGKVFKGDTPALTADTDGTLYSDGVLLTTVIKDKVALVQAKLDQADADHAVAAADHTTAGTDHSTATADHSTAAADHTTAGTDHTTAAADHTASASATTAATTAAETALSAAAAAGRKVFLTQAQYDALETKQSNVEYNIYEEE